MDSSHRAGILKGWGGEPCQPFRDIRIEELVQGAEAWEVNAFGKDQVGREKKHRQQKTREVLLRELEKAGLFESFQKCIPICRFQQQAENSEGDQRKQNKDRQPGWIHEEDVALEQAGELPGDRRRGSTQSERKHQR